MCKTPRWEDVSSSHQLQGDPTVCTADAETALAFPFHPCSVDLIALISHKPTLMHLLVGA